jgi:hypothetical protein
MLVKTDLTISGYGGWAQIAYLVKSMLQLFVFLSRLQLILKTLSIGPESLSLEKMRILLKDPACVARRHLTGWELPGDEAARKWGINLP